MNHEGKPANSRTITNPTPIELRSDILIAECPNPLPPGSRVDLSFEASDDDNPLIVSGKIVSVDKGHAGFRITVRLSSIPKKEGMRLAAVFDLD